MTVEAQALLPAAMRADRPLWGQVRAALSRRNDGRAFDRALASARQHEASDLIAQARRHS